MVVRTGLRLTDTVAESSVKVYEVAGQNVSLGDVARQFASRSPSAGNLLATADVLDHCLRLPLAGYGPEATRPSAGIPWHMGCTLRVGSPEVLPIRQRVWSHINV